MLKLYIGTKFTGITVIPDEKWDDMWRIRKGDRDRLSDMVNFTRAKDAALSWARADGFTVDGCHHPNWKTVYCLSDGPRIARTEEAATTPHAGPVSA